ncbi:MAG: zinc ribbon domain-containing protein [Piscinibacter sp.]|nr:zinc ribbon domain-containing protein [Piscinibacter sp.]
MPIYAYRCDACGHAKDVLQKISDAPLNVCPACGADAFRKQLTAAGFQLKGSGWYVTDFKGGGAKPDAKSGDAKGGDTKPADAKGGEAKGGESKPADTGGSGGSDSSGGDTKSASSAAPAGGCGTGCACH